MEAIILAGGLGTRLRSVVSEVPKCMAPVDGKPFLGYLLDWLARYGISRVILSVGYLREVIIQYIASREWPFEVVFSVEETPLGTGGGIRLALQKCRENQVYVVNGDTFFPVELDRMPFSAPVTIALKPMHDFDRYGKVDFDGELVKGFHEKEPCQEGLVNGGIYALDRSQLDLCLMPARFSFENDVLRELAPVGQVAGWVHDGYFIDIGIPSDYEVAQRELPEADAVLSASDRVMATTAETLFLDRDGVINRWLPGDYVRTWEDFRFLPGILSCLRRWSERFRHILVVSNQRGVAKGKVRPEDLETIHGKMCDAIRSAGGRIDGIYVCTSLAEDDPFRKPQTGMFEAACRDFPDIRADRSVMLGDSESDMRFARNCGMEGILMETAALTLRFQGGASSDS